MDFNYEEALQCAVDYWTPEKIAATVPLDDVSPVAIPFGNDCCLPTAPGNGGNKTSQQCDSDDDDDISLSSSYYISSSSSSLIDDDDDDDPPLSVQNEPEISLWQILQTPYEWLQSLIQPKQLFMGLQELIEQLPRSPEPPLQRDRPPHEPVEKLKTMPYRSIGKICIQNNKPDLHVTAFYIGPSTQAAIEMAMARISIDAALPNTGQGDVPKDSTGLPPTRYRVLTVAHMLDDSRFKNAKTLEFITSSNEIYVIEEYKRHPSYDSFKTGKHVLDTPNDLCVLYVNPIGKKSNSDEYCSINELTPLKLMANAFLNGLTEFKLIGYPLTTHKFGGKMTEVKCKFLKLDTMKSTIEIDNHSAVGMSGGPWIIEARNSNYVYGIQSGNTWPDDNAASPLFCEQLLRPLFLESESEPIPMLVPRST